MGFQPGPDLMPAFRRGAARGLTLAEQHLLTQANAKVPIEEGTLERSGVASVDEAALEGAVSYATPYAVRQHEDMTLRHDDGREPKWLERTVNAESGTVGQIILAAMRAEIGG